MSFADHFSNVAASYAAYRPRYPEALVELLVARSPGRALAWDAGCGNGQLSVALARHFDSVIATDPARAQIDAAEANPRVEYRCEPAEQSTLVAGSADLAVAAQAAHWFDWPRYIAEVARVARPGALAALVGYGGLSVDGAASEVIQGLIGRDAAVGDWLADVVGVLVGVLVWQWLARRADGRPDRLA